MKCRSNSLSKVHLWPLMKLRKSTTWSTGLVTREMILNESWSIPDKRTNCKHFATCFIRNVSINLIKIIIVNELKQEFQKEISMGDFHTKVTLLIQKGNIPLEFWDRYTRHVITLCFGDQKFINKCVRKWVTLTQECELEVSWLEASTTLQLE